MTKLYNEKEVSIGAIEVPKLYAEKTVSTQIGMTSLIGVGGKAPYAHANYFSLAESGRVANFWAENLQAANRLFKLGGKVKIREYVEGDRTFVIITDDRIPSDWYHDKLCFTGSCSPSLEVLEDMYSYHGDPSNEMERYSNPEKYWSDRGGSYDAKNGIISLRIGGNTPTLTDDK